MNKQQDWLTPSARRHRRNFRVLEKSIVAALILVHVLLYWARFIRLDRQAPMEAVEKKLEALHLEDILPIKPPPPPPRQPSIPPVAVAEPDEVPEKITTPIRPVEKKRYRQRQRDDSKVSLDLSLHTDLALTDRPSLDLSQPTIQARNRIGDESIDLGIEIPDAPGAIEEQRSPSLDLTPGGARPARQEPELLQEDDLELPEPSSIKPASYEPETRRQTAGEDLLGADISLVIASTDLSMGIDEYKIWNRINGEFDRWDKGRYGVFPANLQRRGRAIIAHFSYENGVSHTIIWLRGNTKIYVKGDSARNRLQELKKALASMIQLNLKRGGF